VDRKKIGELAANNMQRLYKINVGVSKYISLYRAKCREFNAN